MGKLISALLLLSSISFAQTPPGDFESVKYKCRCGCYDLYLKRPIRYRLPGGGFGTEWGAQHLVVHEDNWGWSHERTIPNVGSSSQCRSYDAPWPRYYGCAGYTDLPGMGGKWSQNGFLTQCRYTPY